MDVEEAIRSRRTHKAYASEALDRATLDELLELARWAPNHHLTNPWRFRVVGPEALASLKEAAGPESAAQARSRAHAGRQLGAPGRTRIRFRTRRTSAPRPCATYIVLLAAHARGLVGYWRTPGVLRSPEGRAAVGMADDEHFVGLIHLGHPRQEQRAARARAGRRVRNVPAVIAREDALAALQSERFDLVVIGGGITGAGVALDAASRGYSVALVETRRLRRGHVEPLVEARPRRAALPPELRPRAGARGAARARADGEAGAAPRARRCRCSCRASTASTPTA